MLLIAFCMLLGLAIAGLVIGYVAYPHRGEDMPHVPWLGEALGKAVEQLPTLDNTEPEREDALTR